MTGQVQNQSNNEQINIDLKEHQSSVEDWDYNKLVRDLHLWAERFNLEFKLQNSVPALMVDQLRRTCYGHFRPGRNAFGLLNEVAINETYISQERYWEALAMLLHELLHAEQEKVGTPGKGNYHNKQYRNRAESVGLIIDLWGCTAVAPAPSPFWDVLQKYGVKVPEMPQSLPVPLAKPGNSKLKLWICGCKPPTRARVAISEFRAKCLKCGQLFVRRT